MRKRWTDHATDFDSRSTKNICHGKAMIAAKRTPCFFCGDDAKALYAPGRPACKECYEELLGGVIPNVIGPLEPPGHAGPHDDDIGSCRTIAVRALEDQ